MLEKSSKFINFLDELQNRKETGQSFKKSWRQKKGEMSKDDIVVN
jgi:hypothetical protein